MATFTTTKFKAVDLLSIKIDMDVPGGAGKYLHNLGKLYEIGGPAYTVTDNGEILLCVGIVKGMYGHIGDIWAFISDKARERGMMLNLWSNKTLESVMKEHRFTRVQAQIDPANKRDIKWVEFLGFKYEGTPRKAGPNQEDMHLYAKVI